MFEHYCHILGLGLHATVDDIKRAYRQKAKELHPDRNKLPGAQERFIEITEAYDYLIRYKTNPTPRAQQAARSNGLSAEEQLRNLREEVRRRAQAYARMRYEEFIKSDYYKTSQAVDQVAAVLGSLLAVIALLSFPFIIAANGLAGVFVCLAMALVLLPLTLPSVKRLLKTDPAEIPRAFGRLAAHKKLQALVISLFNFYIFLQIGLQTLIPFSYLAMAYGIAMVLALTLSLRRARRAFRVLCIGPLTVSLILLVNFVFSYKPVYETYKYYYSSTSLVELEHDAYDDFPGIRAFLLTEYLNRHDNIEYRFETGALGMRVMKDYTLK